MQDSRPRRLTRSRQRMLGGVAAGIADYFDIDPTIVRLLWVLGAFLTQGFALLAYVVAWVVIPEEGSARPPDSSPRGAPRSEGVDSAAQLAGAGPAVEEREGPDRTMLLALGLLAVGFIVLMDRLSFGDWWGWGWGVGELMWPALLIGGGAALLIMRRR